MFLHDNKSKKNTDKIDTLKQYMEGIVCQDEWQVTYDLLSKGDIFNLLIECLNQKIKLENALKEIESLTRNPREYEPSIYTINHIARTSLSVGKW